MKYLLKLLLAAWNGRVLGRFLASAKVSARIEAVRLYVQGVAFAHRVFLAGLMVGGSLLLLLLGSILLHAGVWWLLPWSADAKAWAAVGLGGVYLLVAGGVLRHYCRERTWLQATGAEKAIQSVVARRGD
ncbi:MAG: hypothetical protein WC789_06185 [Lentisphaeria bacterium]|jgi:hypothetical protein